MKSASIKVEIGRSFLNQFTNREFDFAEHGPTKFFIELRKCLRVDLMSGQTVES